jgi:hypothetical protein
MCDDSTFFEFLSIHSPTYLPYHGLKQPKENLDFYYGTNVGVGSSKSHKAHQNKES